MVGKLIGDISGDVIEVWRGSFDGLRDRFDIECPLGGYSLLIESDDGQPYCELRR